MDDFNIGRDNRRASYIHGDGNIGIQNSYR
ncbi:hypothetical protein BJV93_000477 [Clostridium butyricum]|jgi:hypothetical protein|nr:hypothetical protein [Clostridium butyricum]